MNDLKDNLNNVRSRVDKAALAHGIDPSEIQILAVSKRHSADTIRALHALGQVAFGENVVQEALLKIGELGNLELEWHFIGPVQSNKTRDIAGHFDWVHSIDREKVLKRLSQQRDPALSPLNVCIQINIDNEPQKAGVTPEGAVKLAEMAIQLPQINLRGLMAIPRPGQDIDDPSNSFYRMAKLFGDFRAQEFNLDTLSMGMSADLEAAVAAGSTMLRIGTDLMGRRPQ
jgi:pyridoxal phosphate enzyme (YggS family)